MENEVKVPIPIDKILRVGEKVFRLLEKKTASPVEAYGVVRLLCVLFEDVYGFRLDSSNETELRDLVEKVFNRDK